MVHTITATKRYIKAVETYEAKVYGAKATMVRAAVTNYIEATDAKAKAKAIKDITESAKLLKEYDDNKGRRTHRNIIAFFNRMVKKPKMVEALKAVDIETINIEQLLKVQPETKKESGKGSVKTVTGTADDCTVIDTAAAVQSVRDELINRASELAKSKPGDLIDRYLEVTAELENRIAEFDPKKSPATTAQAVALIEKLLQTI